MDVRYIILLLCSFENIHKTSWGLKKKSCVSRKHKHQKSTRDLLSWHIWLLSLGLCLNYSSYPESLYSSGVTSSRKPGSGAPSQIPTSRSWFFWNSLVACTKVGDHGFQLSPAPSCPGVTGMSLCFKTSGTGLVVAQEEPPNFSEFSKVKFSL